MDTFSNKQIIAGRINNEISNNSVSNEHIEEYRLLRLFEIFIEIDESIKNRPNENYK